ncbi:MAG TPA: hypothetical protein VF610_10810 [Segetibacter sp.]
MNINRHNYEEFFLLYVDRELDNNARLQVEKFLEENPDMAAELETFKQLTLDDAPVLFNNKSVLYKQEHGISLSNYEEYFLLLVDDELSATEKEDVEKFVLQHPQLQKQFTQLQQTKLMPPTLSFKGKAALYRREKIRRIIPIAWARFTVAAAVMALAFSVWMFNKADNHQPPVAISKPAEPPAKKGVNTQIKKPVTQQTVAASTQQKQPNEVKTPVKIQNQKEPKSSLALAAKQKNRMKETEPSIVAKSTKTTKEPNAQKEQKYDEQAIVNADTDTNHEPSVLPETKTIARLAKRPVFTEEPVLFSHTLYKEIEADEEEKTVYIGSSQINKNKLKGLFKKASGFLGKKLGRSSADKTFE